MTLLFSDGSSQLRQGRSSGRGSGGEVEVEGVCLALPVTANTSKSANSGAAVTVEFFLLPLDSRRPRVNQWTRYAHTHTHTHTEREGEACQV